MAQTPIPDRRPHITQKARIGAKRTLYLSTDADALAGEQPQEVFFRVKGHASAEVVLLYDLLARTVSLMLQEGISAERVGALFYGAKCAPAGPVGGDPRIKNCGSTPDYIGRHLLVYFAGRDDLAHAPMPAPEPPPEIETRDERESNP